MKKDEEVKEGTAVYFSEKVSCLLVYLLVAVLGVYIDNSESAQQLPYSPETFRRSSFCKGVPVLYSFSIPIKSSHSSPTTASVPNRPGAPRGDCQEPRTGRDG